MIGTIANTTSVIAGSLLGLLLKKGIPENIKKIIMMGLGLFTGLLGMKMGLEFKKPVVVVLSLIIGGALGEIIKIEDFLENLGAKIKKIFAIREDTTFAQGFVTASILFSMGPMTVIGCIQDGLLHKPELLFVKSLMDGVSAAILSSFLGVGVLFSALTVLLFQGSVTLFAQQLKFLSEPYFLNDFTATGGLIVLAIGIRLLGIKEIKAGNFLPALIFVIFFIFISGRF